MGMILKPSRHNVDFVLSLFLHGIVTQRESATLTW